MNKPEIEAALQEIARPYADRRVNVFEIQIAQYESGNLALRGTVLEESNRSALAAGLSERFPDLRVDLEAVKVARKLDPVVKTVATNLTSVHDEPSFLAEQITQMVNGTPVEILWEDGDWSFVRQMDGYLGWTYTAYLTGGPVPHPSHMVISPVGLLRGAPSDASPIITRVLGGTAVRAAGETSGWLSVEMAGGWKGFMPAADLRKLSALGCEPGGDEGKRAALTAFAKTMIGVPYLWGGCTANGIDCSGFAQLMHRWVGITLPRDADMQCAAGRAVEPPFRPGDLLFFGEQGERRRITHVAISLGGWDIIHSSRARNGVQIDNVQGVPGLRKSFLCGATYFEN